MPWSNGKRVFFRGTLLLNDFGHPQECAASGHPPEGAESAVFFLTELARRAFYENPVALVQFRDLAQQEVDSRLGPERLI